MKYCKSKRSYFYKVVGDKKTRISIEEYKSKMKGGTVESDGKLEKLDFSKENIHKGIYFVNQQIHKNVLDEINLKVLRKPFYLLGEPVIFFGIDENNFKYACYYVFDKFSKKIIVKDINKNVIDILTIDIKYLIELFWGLVNIRKKDKTFMDTLYKLLREYFSYNIEKLRPVLYDDAIREMTLSYNTGRKNSYGNRKTLSVFNLQQSKQIINNLKLPTYIESFLVNKLKSIMEIAESMRKKDFLQYTLKIINQKNFKK